MFLFLGFIADEHRKGPFGTPGASPTELLWVDSVYNSMSLDERIGQLFMIRAHSNLGAKHEEEVKKQIAEFHVGGLCFFQGTVQGHERLIKHYQSLSKTPLMIAMDAEWGLGMRLKEDGISFPRQMTLGAIKDQKLIYQMGQEIGEQLSELGIHVNFAPVADVNNNKENPVIHTRSFGEDPLAVAERCNLYASGMQASGIMACLKHFPGHGDTDTDSHLDLPVIPHDKDRLDSIELLPFRVMSDQGIPSMMVAHLSLPSLDSIADLPATLSSKIIQDILREELQYDGLIFTDALEMKGVTKNHKPGQLEVEALKAGNDVLLLPLSIEDSFKKIKESLSKEELDEERFTHSVKRILLSKYRYGIFNRNPYSFSKARINVERAIALNYKLYENAITLVKNQNDILPVRDLTTSGICALHLGVKEDKVFENTSSFYSDIDHYYINSVKAPSALEIINRINRSDARYVIINLNLLDDKSSNNFGYSNRLKTV
jgi:beta-glucosidase-like glycosyl hydrolase